MKPYSKYLIAILATCIVIALVFTIVQMFNHVSAKEIFAGLGIFYVMLCTPILFFVGLILLIVNKTKTMGTAMLTASGIMLIIGFGLCSVAPINI